MKPKLIGICGGTCSGKTTLVNELAKDLGSEICMISFDEYFVGMGKLKGQVVDDWESPTLYEYDRFLKDLEMLSKGNKVEIICHSRESTKLGIKKKLIEPKQYTIVEGFLIFHDPSARNIFNTKIFVDLDEDEMIRRRLARSEGSSNWNDPEYITKRLLPGHRKYVLPQRKYADIVLNGSESTSVLKQKIKGVFKS